MCQSAAFYTRATELHFKCWKGSFLGHQIRDFQAEPVFLSTLAPGLETIEIPREIIRTQATL